MCVTWFLKVLLPLILPCLQPEEVCKAMCSCGLSFPICEMGTRTVSTSRWPQRDGRQVGRSQQGLSMARRLHVGWVHRFFRYQSGGNSCLREACRWQIGRPGVLFTSRQAPGPSGWHRNRR